MRVHLCGVRGSSPSPGAEFVRIGGQTSCVAVAHDDERDPRLLLDGGTGLRRASALLDGRAFVGTIVLGHLHWDHTQGLPFFEAGGKEGADVKVLLPEQGCDAHELLSHMMSPPFFPIEPRQLGKAWSFATIDEGTFELEGFTVTTRELPHPGGRTFGLRVSDDHSTLCYMSDHGPLELGDGPEGWGPYHEAALDLVHHADLVLHDAQFTPEELAHKRHYGHSAVPYAVELARLGGAKHLLLYHHDPGRTDDEVDRLVADMAGRGVSVAAAFEGMVVDL